MSFLKVVITITFFVFTIKSFHAQELFVKLKNGTTQQIALSTIRSITYSGNIMNVKLKNGSVQSWNVFDVAINSYRAITSVEEVKNMEKLFSLYPNPVAESLNLQFDFADGSEYEIEVHDLMGSTVLRSGKTSKGLKNLSVDVSGLPIGVYLCCLKSGSQIFTQQFVKK